MPRIGKRYDEYSAEISRSSQHNIEVLRVPLEAMCAERKGSKCRRLLNYTTPPDSIIFRSSLRRACYTYPGHQRDIHFGPAKRRAACHFAPYKRRRHPQHDSRLARAPS